MNFFINKGSTLPVLRLEIIKDGRYDYDNFFELIQNSDIFFCMSDIVTGNKIIGKKKALCEFKQNSCGEEEYYLTYKFNNKETVKSGTFVGKFIIEFEGDTLIVPIRDTLYINITDQNIKK